MWAWMASRPRHCLRIGARQLVWAEARRDWMGRPRHRCAVTELAPGLIRVSPVEVNIADVTALEARLRALIGSGRQLRVAGRTLIRPILLPIALVLPDLCVRALVLQLDQLPARPEEREAVIRWRVSQELLMPLTEARIVTQVLSHGRSAKGPYTVLAVIVQEAVLAQYEAVCESAGLFPFEIDIVSFRLFNLWASATGWSRTSAGDLMWLNVADGGLTMFLFHEERLVFFRTKLHGGSPASDVRSNAGPEEQRRRVIDECLASIQVCRERCPRLAVKRLVFAADEPDSKLQDLLAQELNLTVQPLNWSQIQRAGWRPAVQVTDTFAMPAIAGVV